MKNLLLASALAIGTVLTGTALAAEQRGVTDSEIIIGAHTDLSGVTAVWGVNNSNAIRMVFDEVNAAGGINGRKIRYIVEDNQYQVPRAIQAANKLLNKDNVFLMIANDGTPMNNAVMPEQLEKGVPNMFPLTSARSMYEPYHRLKFGLASSYYDGARAGMKYFIEQRGKKAVCLMSQDTDFGRDITDGVHDQAKAMGVTLKGETLHKPTDTDFSAPVARMRDAKCDLLMLGTIVRDTNQIVAAVRKTGWDVDIVGPVSSYDNAVSSAPGGVNEGYYAMTVMLFMDPNDKRPAVKAFADAYQKKFGHPANFAAQVGNSAASVLVEGLKRAGKNLTLDTFIAAMESIKDFHDIFDSPAVSFGPNIRQGSNKSFLAQVKGGQWIQAAPTPLGY